MTRVLRIGNFRLQFISENLTYKYNNQWVIVIK